MSSQGAGPDAAELDILSLSKPWKSSSWKPSNRRNKNLKQILAEAARKDAAAQQSLRAAAEADEEAGRPPAAEPEYTPPAVSYSNIEAAPSMHPSSRRPYCDVTGLNAPYRHPRTGLRYHDREVYAFAATLGQEQVDMYLEARSANFVLK